VPYSLPMMALLVVEMALAAFMVTAFGLMLASRIGEVQSFQVVVQFFVMPMFFLSGAMFPLSGLPSWLAFLTKVDPLSYAVDPMRRVVFAHTSVPALAQATLNPGVHWGSWLLPVWFELLLVAGVALAAMAVAVWQFARAD
jgi:ABC-2 type transport system permease protein